MLCINIHTLPSASHYGEQKSSKGSLCCYEKDFEGWFFSNMVIIKEITSQLKITPSSLSAQGCGSKDRHLVGDN